MDRLPECDLKPPISPGKDAVVHHADFGRVGFATCFDIYFPEVWQRLADQEAEFVIWSSDISGGAPLRAHAANFHFYVVSSNHGGLALTPDCEVYDITGERLLYNRSTDVNVSRITFQTGE